MLVSWIVGMLPRKATTRTTRRDAGDGPVIDGTWRRLYSRTQGPHRDSGA